MGPVDEKIYHEKIPATTEVNFVGHHTVSLPYRILLTDVSRDIRRIAIGVFCFVNGILPGIVEDIFPAHIVFKKSQLIFHRTFKEERKETPEVIVAGCFLPPVCSRH